MLLDNISKFKPNQPDHFAESSSYATDSTDSSFSSATSTTSTGTVVCNFNALKPKNNQTHSVSQTSLQSTGVTTAASTKSPPTVDKSNKCHLVQCSYANLPANASQKDQQTSSNNHGTIMFRDQRCEKKVLSSRAGPLGTIPQLLAVVYSLVFVFKICCYGCLGRKQKRKRPRRN